MSAHDDAASAGLTVRAKKRLDDKPFVHFLPDLPRSSKQMRESLKSTELDFSYIRQEMTALEISEFEEMNRELAIRLFMKTGLLRQTQIR